MAWLQSNAVREEIFYRNSFQKRWPSLTDVEKQIEADTSTLLGRKYVLSSHVMGDFSPVAASKLFEQEIREAVCEYF